VIMSKNDKTSKDIDILTKERQEKITKLKIEKNKKIQTQIDFNNLMITLLSKKISE